MVNQALSMSPADREVLSSILRRRARGQWGRTTEPAFFQHTGIWQAGDVNPTLITVPGSWVGGSTAVHFAPYQVCTSQNNISAPSSPSFGHAITGYGDAKSRLNSWQSGIDFIPRNTFVNGGEIWAWFDGYYTTSATAPAGLKATFIVEPNAVPTGNIGAACGAASSKASVFTSAGFGGINETAIPFSAVLRGKALGSATHHWDCAMFCKTGATPLAQQFSDFGTQRKTGASGYDWSANHVKLNLRFKIDNAGDGAGNYNTGADLGKCTLTIQRFAYLQLEEPL